MQIIRKLRIFEYWIKLRNTNNNILRAVYDDMEQTKNGWLMKVKREFDELGLCYIWNLSHVDRIVYNVIKEKINDTFKQHCYNIIMTTSKEIMYKHLVNEFKLQNYLIKPLDVRCLKEITNIRICTHKLNLEFGRHRNVERSDFFLNCVISMK